MSRIFKMFLPDMVIFFLAVILSFSSRRIISMAAESDAEAVVISEGVYVDGQHVGGMTADELQAFLESEVQALKDSMITIAMGNDRISVSFGELGLTWENTGLAEEISGLGTTGNIIDRYKEQKDLQNQNVSYELQYSLDESAVREFVESCTAYNSEPTEGTLYTDENGKPQISGGTDGLTLNVEATTASLMECLLDYESGDYVIEATVSRTPPTITADILEQFTDVLGTASTSYASSSAARCQNIENGTEKVSNLLLMPGETFSMLELVTPFTEENGYTIAPSYASGEVVESYGGGICQVSTTLYNAVLKAELQVNQRYSHSMLVSYVDPSKDAAISEGSSDFRFTNSLDNPIFIVGHAYDGALSFTVYGVETREASRTIEFVSEIVAQTNTAITAVLWENIYYDGVLSDTVRVNISSYMVSSS